MFSRTRLDDDRHFGMFRRPCVEKYGARVFVVTTMPPAIEQRFTENKLSPQQHS